jgi:hypothetical protein
MEFIRDLIESLSSGWGDRLGVLFPLMLAAVVGLYTLWLLIGYLRVSQVGIHDDEHAAEGAPRLPQSADAGAALGTIPRGVPYCPVDRLQYPEGARFCTVCERDLSRDCVNCGATLRASEPSCYRCGVRTGAAQPLLT